MKNIYLFFFLNWIYIRGVQYHMIMIIWQSVNLSRPEAWSGRDILLQLSKVYQTKINKKNKKRPDTSLYDTSSLIDAHEWYVTKNGQISCQKHYLSIRGRHIVHSSSLLYDILYTYTGIIDMQDFITFSLTFINSFLCFITCTWNLVQFIPK